MTIEPTELSFTEISDSAIYILNGKIIRLWLNLFLGLKLFINNLLIVCRLL